MDKTRNTTLVKRKTARVIPIAIDILLVMVILIMAMFTSMIIPSQISPEAMDGDMPIDFINLKEK